MITGRSCLAAYPGSRFAATGTGVRRARRSWRVLRVVERFVGGDGGDVGARPGRLTSPRTARSPGGGGRRRRRTRGGPSARPTRRRARRGGPADLLAAGRHRRLVVGGPPGRARRVLAGQRAAGQDVGGDEPDPAALERGEDRRGRRTGGGRRGCRPSGRRSGTAPRWRRRRRGRRASCCPDHIPVPHARARPDSISPATCSTTTSTGGAVGARDGVDDVDVVEAHAAERPVELGRGVLVAASAPTTACCRP